MMVRILADRSADAVNLKISKVGGLTKARVIRDLAVAHGLPLNIEVSSSVPHSLKLSVRDCCPTLDLVISPTSTYFHTVCVQ